MKVFFVGIGIGALIGIAIAPKSGAETRRDLLRRGGERFRSFGKNFSGAWARLRGPERARPWVDEQSGERSRSSVKQSSTASNVESLLAIINDWPEARLIEIDGIGPGLALKIIQGRPYGTTLDLTETKILPPSAIEALRKAA